MKTLCLLAVVVAGCAASEPTLGTTESHVETENRLATNRLATNRLATNRLATNRLATNGLEDATTIADLKTMASDDGGRELLTYMVSCALPEGQSISVDTDSGTYTFDGLIGLTPDWVNAPLSVTDRRWLSACLLARVNYYGVTVHISMRGDSPALAITPEEGADYPLYEGAFWGDLFVDGPQDKNACISEYKATDPQVADVPLRQCTVPSGDGTTWCDFTAAGTCEDVCSGRDGENGYTSCAGAGQVINVFLQD
jgi:hypothetical protein